MRISFQTLFIHMCLGSGVIGWDGGWMGTENLMFVLNFLLQCYLDMSRHTFFPQRCKKLFDVNIFIYLRKCLMLNQNYKYSMYKQ